LVTIGELSRRGEGVAKVSGFVIFVPGAKADAEAKVKIKIERVSARFANASLVEGGSVNVEDSGDETSEEQEETDSGDSQTDSDSMVERV
jgi:predicted RNA-binding protein with TRAM domain